MSATAITVPSSRQLATFPLDPAHEPLWRAYKAHLSSFWVPAEIDFSRDYADFCLLSAHQQRFLLNVLGFFAIADSIVNENLITRFMSDIRIPEAKYFYSVQSMMELIHAETYSLMIDAVTHNDAVLKQATLNPLVWSASISHKAQIIQKWMDESLPIGQRLVAFTCVEGLSFSASFASIFYFRKRNLMPGITLGNQFIIRDEALHTDFTVMLFKDFLPADERPDTATAHTIVKEFVDAERSFIQESITYEAAMGELTRENLNQYVQHIADLLCDRLGYPRIFNTPFPAALRFMDTLALENKTNFFERRVSEYRKAGVDVRRTVAGGHQVQNEWAFDTSADF